MLLHRLLSYRKSRARSAERAASDVYFVSYPKCGATWTRLLLGKYVQDLAGTSTLPLFDGARYDDRLTAIRAPRITFTHAPLLWDEQRASDLTLENTIAPFAHARVVLITRYPLDALVSCQAQWKHQLKATVPEPAAFIDDPVHGLEKLLAFHALWAKHRGSVLDFLLLRYEDFRRSTFTESRRLLGFVGLPFDACRLEEAIAFASFSNLQKLQLSPHVPVYPTSGYKVFGPIDASNPESFRVRRGIAGGYRDDLPATKYQLLEAVIAQRMDPIFGYRRAPQRSGPEPDQGS